MLLVTLATLRADYIGSHGSSDVQTPHLDRLAADGVRFQRNVAPSQCTNPSRASVMTGLYTARHTVVNNRTRLPEGALTSSIDVLPSVLDLLGLEQATPEVSGRSLKPALFEPDAKIHDAVFSEAVNGVIRAVYADGYKCPPR